MQHSSGHKMHHGIDDSMRSCIQECTNCHGICVETVTHCLEMGGKHAEAAHIRLMLDCAEICQTSANFLLRGSELHGRTCGVCAEVCDRCAKECESHTGDEHMQACAKTCRSCAESCRKMAA